MNAAWWPPKPFILLQTLQRDKQTGLKLLGPYFLCKGSIAKGSMACVKQGMERCSQKPVAVKCYRFSSLLNKNVTRSWNSSEPTSALHDVYEGIRVMRQIKTTSDSSRCENLYDVLLVLNQHKEKLNKAFRVGFFAKLYLVVDYFPLGCVMIRYDSPRLDVTLREKEKNPLKKQFFSLHHAFEQSSIEDKQNRNEYCEEIVKCFSRDIVIAINHLHTQDIVHWDIKPDNILMERNGRVKLGDFNVAARLQYKRRKNYGTYAFSSPELCESCDDNGVVELDAKACDMWALGVTIYVLLKGSVPFHANNPQELFHNILHSSFDITHLTGFSDSGKTCLVSLLCKNPINRLKALDLLNHEWLKKVDYIYSKEYAERLLQLQKR